MTKDGAAPGQPKRVTSKRASSVDAGPPAMLSVGELARRSGLRVSAIHFYERQGLIRSERTAANHRRYPRSTLRLLAVIKVGQGAGLPLACIEAALKPALENRQLSAAGWARISANWRDDLNARIAALTRIRDRLTGCIGCGCLSLETCRSINPDDRAATLGPGALGLDGRIDAMTRSGA